MKGKIKNKNLSNTNKNINKNKKSFKRKKLLFKNTLHLKIDYLINKIKKYKNPNEYTRQDQDQKIMKYMKLQPVEYILNKK